MVHNQASFKEAAAELKLDLSTQECELIYKRKEFQKLLRQEKLRFHSEVANEPTRTKASAVGMMQVAIENLMAQGEYDKAVMAIEKLAKIEGWAGSDSTINVFAGLTARDIDEAKKRIQAQIEPTKHSGPAPEVLTQ